MAKYVDELEKKKRSHEKEVDKRYQAQFDGLQRSITDLGRIGEAINELKRENKARAGEDTHRKKIQTEWENRITAALNVVEELQRAQKLLSTGTVPKSRVDTQQTQVDVLTNQLAQAHPQRAPIGLGRHLLVHRKNAIMARSQVSKPTNGQRRPQKSEWKTHLARAKRTWRRIRG